jgi:hypothetical protein
VTPIQQANAEIGRRFSRLIFAALESPATVDRNALLIAADVFLSAAQGGDPDVLSLARLMAASAMDFSVFSSPEDHANLTALARAFHMTSVLKTAVDKMAN